jgi:hypothetical protein
LISSLLLAIGCQGEGNYHSHSSAKRGAVKTDNFCNRLQAIAT